MFTRLAAARADASGEVTARLPRATVRIEVECCERLSTFLHRGELRRKKVKRRRRSRIYVHGALARNIGKVDGRVLRRDPGIIVPREARRKRVLRAAGRYVDRRARRFRGAAAHGQFDERQDVVMRRQHRRDVTVRVGDADVRLLELFRSTIAQITDTRRRVAGIETVFFDDVQVVWWRAVAVVRG